MDSVFVWIIYIVYVPEHSMKYSKIKEQTSFGGCKILARQCQSVCYCAWVQSQNLLTLLQTYESWLWTDARMRWKGLSNINVHFLNVAISVPTQRKKDVQSVCHYKIQIENICKPI